MNRRQFLASTFAASLTVPSLRAFGAEAPHQLYPQEWNQFKLATRVTLPAVPGPAQLWLPLAQTSGDYQIASAPGHTDGNRAKVVYDARYGAPILRVVWEEDDREPRTIEVEQFVAVRNRTAASQTTQPLTEAERQFWSAPTASVPLDGIVLATAAQITAGHNTPRDRLRAIYDWVIDHTYRDPDVPGCGRGKVKAMLETGQLGGKCADINGLMVGLARAAGFPAREVFGLRVAPSGLFSSLGVSGDCSKAQHCRAEVFLDGEGWLPVDPADVRKVVLTEKIPLEAGEVRALRNQLFGYWEMNWIGYNSATDITLPGTDGPHQPDFAFLMYPRALTAERNCPCTDPEHFRYEITATASNV